MRSLVDEILVARQLAALRGAGWSTLDALGLVSAALDDGALKRQLGEALTTLRAGAPVPEADLLVATVARGDAATAESLGHLGDALELQQAAVAGRRQLIGSVGVLLLTGTLLVTAAGWGLLGVANEHFGAFGSALPAPTQFAVDLLWVCRWAGPAAFVAVVALLAWLGPARLPGVRKLLAASKLLQFSSAVRAGVPEPVALRLLDEKAAFLAQSRLGLDDVERGLLQHLAAQGGAAGAARVVARELELDGRARTESLAWWVGLLVAVVVLQFVAFVAFAFTLPLFSIAGAIK